MSHPPIISSSGTWRREGNTVVPGRISLYIVDIHKFPFHLWALVDPYLVSNKVIGLDRRVVGDIMAFEEGEIGSY